MNADATTHAETSTERPLQGWKEIAVYLDRDESTARRWEREVDLPIRRHRADRRSSVYAYPSEIEAWRAAQPIQSESKAPAPSVPLWRRMEAWAAVGVAVAAGLVIAYGPFLNPKNPVAEAAEDSMRAEQVWTGDDVGGYSRLSGDGKRLSFVSPVGDLWVRDLSSGAKRRIIGEGSWEMNSSNPETHALSRDGQEIAYVWYAADRNRFQLRVGPVPGPNETHQGKVIFESPSESGGWIELFGWASDDTVVFLHSAEDDDIRLFVGYKEEGRVEPLKSLAWSYPEGVEISPDGAWVAYGVRPDPIAAQHDIHLLAMDGSREVAIVEHPADDTPVAWTPDGSHLLFRSRRSGNEGLWAVAVSDGQRVGAPRLVSSETSLLSSVGLTPEGDLYYLKSTGSRDIYETEINLSTGSLTKPPEPIATGFAGGNTVPFYSPDGRFLAYFSNRSLRRYASANRIIVVRNVDTGEERDIIPPVRALRSLSWSPDSKSLLFRGRDGKGRAGAYRMSAEGGDTEILLHLPSSATNLHWMPDGLAIYYRDKAGPGAAHWIHDTASGERRQILPPGDDAWVQASPDGARFAVVDRRRVKDTTLLLTLDVQTGRERELLRLSRPDGAELPTQWTPDGKTILFWRFSSTEDRSRRELWTIPASGGEACKTDLAFSHVTGRAYLSLHPDGKRLLFSAGDPQHEIWKLSNFLSRLGVSD